MNKLEVPDHPLAKLILPLLKREDSDMGTDSVVLYEKNQEAEVRQDKIIHSIRRSKRGKYISQNWKLIPHLSFNILKSSNNRMCIVGRITSWSYIYIYFITRPIRHVT